MTSPFIPCSFTYGDAPAGGAVMPMVIAGRDPSDTIDLQYQAGYLWLSSLDQGGSGNLWVQSGNTSGEPNWTSVTAGSAGGVSTLSDGSTQVSPVGGNIALEGTANQIISTSDAPGHEITFSIPAVFIAPGSIKATGTMEVGTDLTVNGDASVTGDLAVTGNGTITGDLTVTGNLVTGGITENGNVGINTSGTGTTTIGNASAGLIKFDVGTGDFKINGGGNTIQIGTDLLVNTIEIGNDIGATSIQITSGIGDIDIEGSTAAKITLGASTQTGLIVIGRSTAGENVSINDVTPAASRTTTVGGGTITGVVTDTIDIAPDGATTSASAVKTLNLNTGGVTLGSVLTNIATGNRTSGTHTTSISTGTGTKTVNVGNADALTTTTILGPTNINNSSAGTTTIGGASAGAIGIVVGSGGNFTMTTATAGATMSFGSLTQTGTMTFGDSTAGQNISIGDGINVGAQVISIGNGNSGANSTVNILSGTGTAGAGTLALGNNTRVTVAGLADIAPAASRTVTVGGGTITTAITDTVDIGPDGATTNASATKTVTINSGGVTLGSVLTNIATGAVTSGTHTTAIATGNRAAGTMALNLMTGTGTKTLNMGNADGLTTINMAGTVLKSTNPAFLAYLAATAVDKTGNGATYTIGTDALTEVFDRGSNFNTNGTFTAPVTGIYDLRAQVTVTGNTIATTFVISIVTTLRTYTHTFIKAAGSQDESVLIAALCDMTATNTATVTITVSGEAGNTSDILGAASSQTYFCGCLVA